MPDSRDIPLPSTYTLPPCPRCKFWDPGLTTTICRSGGGEFPIFYASLKFGPEFKCYEEKNAPLRPNPR